MPAIKRSSKPKVEIPTASMPDVVFMLLLFFMVATVIKKYQGLKVDIPEAYKIEKLETRTHTSFLWIDKDDQVVMDDVPIVEVSTLANIAYQKIKADPQMIVFMRADKEAKMGVVSDVQEQLRDASALRIYYGTKTKANP